MSKSDDEFLDEILGDEDELEDLEEETVEEPSPKKEVVKPKKEKKERKQIKPNLKGAKISITVLVGLVILGVLVSFSIRKEIFSNGRVGEDAVKLLYEFNNVKDLEENLVELRSMMTERCYYKTTVLNSSKSLNTYLKLKQQRTVVNILEKKPGFILYSLDNPNLSDNRLFIFSYELNGLGQIEDVREFEAIDFYETNTKTPSDEELDKLIEDWNKE